MEAHVIAEVEPFVPVRDGRAGATRADSLGDCFLSKAEITEEVIPDGGVHT